MGWNFGGWTTQEEKHDPLPTKNGWVQIIDNCIRNEYRYYYLYSLVYVQIIKQIYISLIFSPYEVEEMSITKDHLYNNSHGLWHHGDSGISVVLL